MDQVRIGRFLAELRKEKEMTQEQFAEKLHVTRRTVSRWETGSNLPDVALLVEIADFYDVDVREIIEGGRKSEMMDKEIKDVANKMAEYAGTEKSKQLKWIQLISLIGVAILTLAIVMQCSVYNSNVMSAGAIFASFIALIILVVITLYVTGVLQKLIKRKVFVSGVVIVTSTLLLISIRFIISVVIVLAIGFVSVMQPFHEVSGIEHYDKSAIVKEYQHDMDSGFFIFPDNIDNMIDASYKSSVRTGLFDSDAYFILNATYDQENFEKEVNRLSQITCEIKSGDDTFVSKVKYDENTYNYPAYIASDGYDYVYEYALLDEENASIIYILLSYPEYTNLKEYKDYMKKDSKKYEIGNKPLERFTIYAHKDPDMDGWIEYGD